MLGFIFLLCGFASLPQHESESLKGSLAMVTTIVDLPDALQLVPPESIVVNYQPNHDAEEMVTRQRKFPGYDDGIDSDYTLLFRIEPQGEWASSRFDFDVRRGVSELSGRDSILTGLYSLSLIAENDGQFMTGRFEVRSLFGSSEFKTIVLPVEKFEFFWVKVERNGQKIVVSSSVEENAESFLEVISFSLGEGPSTHWPMTISQEGLDYNTSCLIQFDR